MENLLFELQNVANTVEMAVSSFKMLQIARNADRCGQNRISKKTKRIKTGK
jgi:hypothetical protein